MSDPAKSIDTYVIGDSLSVNVGKCSTKLKGIEYFSFDFVGGDKPSFETYMTRDKLRGLAVFILNYLENN